MRSEGKFKKFKAEKEELGLSVAAKTAKKVEGGVFDRLESALFIWFRHEREKGCPVIGPILLENVSKFHLNTQGPFQQVRGFNGGFAGELDCLILRYVAKN